MSDTKPRDPKAPQAQEIVKVSNDDVALFKKIIRQKSEYEKGMPPELAERFASVIDEVGREGKIEKRFALYGDMYAVLFKAFEVFAEKRKKENSKALTDGMLKKELGQLNTHFYRQLYHLSGGTLDTEVERLLRGERVGGTSV